MEKPHSLDLFRRAALALLAATALSACEGKQGATGPAGPAGADGTSGAAGADGVNGANGANGTDGTDGTNGANGTDGTNGTNGANGTNGTDGTQGPPGPQGDAGIAVDKATVEGVVFDTVSGGPVADAGVVLDPVGLQARTNQYGEYRFTGVPLAVVKVKVSAPRLVMLGNDLSSTTQQVTSESDFMPLVAGFTSRINLGVERLAGMVINLDKFHNSTRSTTVFKDANCVACHGNPRGQQSRVSTIHTFHGIATHSSLACTFCHSATIDLVDAANTVIRKPVNAATSCTGCHARYPSSFCTSNCP